MPRWLRDWLCRHGRHAGGHVVSGWADDGRCMNGWRCSHCGRVEHLGASVFVDPIPPERVAAQRAFQRASGDRFMWEPTRPSEALSANGSNSSDPVGEGDKG